MYPRAEESSRCREPLEKSISVFITDAHVVNPVARATCLADSPAVPVADPSWNPWRGTGYASLPQCVSCLDLFGILVVFICRWAKELLDIGIAIAGDKLLDRAEKLLGFVIVEVLCCLAKEVVHLDFNIATVFLRYRAEELRDLDLHVVVWSVPLPRRRIADADG